MVGAAGRVTAVETLDVASVFDKRGRFNPTFVPGSEKRVEADTVILAIGQQPDTECLSADAQIEITPRGLVAVDPVTLATTMPGVFAGGDLAFGPRIVIDAVADGKRAALAIHQHLGGSLVPRVRAWFRAIELHRAGDPYDRIPRQQVPALPVARRTGFREVEEGDREAQARLEASRCLWCHVETVFDSERCILCSGCVEICPEACLALVPIARLRENGGARGHPRGPRRRRRRRGHSEGQRSAAFAAACAPKCCPTGAITMEMLELDESPGTALGLFAERMQETRR